MKKTTLLVISILIISILAFSAFAKNSKETQNNGKPFQELWDAINDLYDLYDPDYWVDSFFDVFYEINVTHNEDVDTLQTQIDDLSDRVTWLENNCGCSEEPEAICGDGIVEGDEECDDGNTNDGDGCSAICTTESSSNCPVGEVCDDGNACTDNDVCSAEEICEGTLNYLSCNDDNVCTHDVCDASTGCNYVYNDGPCDDGDACTMNDFCSEGVCYGGIEVPPQDCSTGQLGVCSFGTTSCISGQLTCNRIISPSAEVCDGLDNDCDGSEDEGLGGSNCNTGLLGVCSSGTTACVSGQISCVQNVQASSEVCYDGLDNDCDGTPDDGCVVDADQDGYYYPGDDCDDTNADIHPGAVEICDGYDNDCSDGGGRNAFDDDSDGVLSCEDCDDSDSNNYPGNTEVCDGQDNNCVNGIDENFDLDNDINNCGACDRACDGTNVDSLSCNSGVCDSTCNSGFANCDMPIAPFSDDGCETDLIAENNNCAIHDEINCGIISDCVWDQSGSYCVSICA